MSAQPEQADGELRRLLRTGDTAAIVARFEGLAWKVTDGYYLPGGGDREDLVQEARIGIAKAVRDFRGVPEAFPAFASLCAYRQVITAVKHATRHKHGPLNHAVGIDAPMNAGEDGTLADVIPLHGADPVERLAAREELAEVLAVFTTELTDLERDAVTGVALGRLPYETVAAALETTTKSIDNALQRAQHKFSDAGVRARALGGPPPARPRRRRPQTVYIERAAHSDDTGAARPGQAIAAARRRLGERFQTAEVVDVSKCALGPDGRERRDTRGRPRADGVRPKPMWRVTLREQAA